MQALRSLFTRTPADKGASLQTPAPAQPVALSPSQLEQVAGGLPRVSGPAAIVALEPLPRVS